MIAPESLPPVAPGEPIRDLALIGPYRVVTYEEPAARFRVEVHELKGRGWKLARGPFPYADLEAALTYHLNVAESLRARVGVRE